MPLLTYLLLDTITLVIIAVGLSMDSFAVSISCGMAVPRINFFRALIVAASLALFQGLLPLLGWYMGQTVYQYIVEVDHWIAFGILSTLGLKMIMERVKPNGKRAPINPFNPVVLITISLGTSIDALVVGLSFAVMNIHIMGAVFIIALTTGIVSMLGLLFGKNAGVCFGQKMEIVGGIMLMMIGTKILLEHLI